MRQGTEQVCRTALLILITFLASGPAAGGADGGGGGSDQSDVPRSPRAAAARKRHDDAAAKARQAYLSALIEADRQLIVDLDAAFDAAMQGKLLDEANRIDRAKKAAAALLKEHQAQLAAGGEAVGVAAGGPRTFNIRADRPWQPTVEVRKGQKLKVTAKGTWCAWVGRRKDTTFGPDGLPGSGDHYGGLQGRIGDGEPFFIGSSKTLTADRDGPLTMEMADKAKDDNDGALEVSVSAGE